MKNQIENLIKTLGVTEAEALDIIKCDEEIDKGEKLFELSAEQEKASKEARKTGSRVQTAPTKRVRKTDNDKKFLIDFLVENLKSQAEILEITNTEREFLFKFNEKKYKIVLSAPRT